MESNKQLNWPLQLRQFAVMIDAGVPIDTALNSLLARSGKSRPKLQKAHRLVKRGVSLPNAFKRAAVIKDFDHAMLNAADAAGRLADGLNHISERRVNQLQRVDSFKTSLILPKALVVLGALAGILLRVAVGKQSASEAIVSVGWVVALFYFVTYATVVIVRADTRIWMSWFWRYPVVLKSSEWCRMALEYFFYNSFIWQISAGMAASAAAQGCSHLLNAKHFQYSVEKASESMARGTNMMQALADEGLVLTDRLHQVLLIADQAGTHESAIKHELSLQRIVLKQKADNFFKWLPRLFYVVALIVISNVTSM